MSLRNGSLRRGIGGSCGYGADGQAGELGHLLWLDLTPSGYRQISRAWLFAARESWTLPVLSHGLLYVCQNSREVGRGKDTRLLCYDMRA